MYFQFRIEADANEVGSLLELADLALSQGKTKTVYSHLAAALTAISGRHVFTASDVTAYSVEDNCELIRESHKYLDYRRERPLEYFLQYYPEQNERYGYRHLWLAFASAFVTLQKSTGKLDGDTVDGILSFLYEGRAAVNNAIARVAASTANEHAEATVEEKITILTTLLLVLPMTTLYETSWVSGFLIGTAKVDQTTFEMANEQFLQENDFSPWREEVTEGIMLSVNSIWKLFPDKPEGEKPEGGTGNLSNLLNEQNVK
jgi:hypothetical protein